MILRDQGDTLRVVTQTDHAHWAYQLLSAWPSLAEHPRRDAILQATRQHDRGWQGIDASPVVDSDGRPHDFRSLPTPLREDVWKQTVERTRWPTESPTSAEGAMTLWTEMLIAQHAWRIHRPGPSGLPGSSFRSDDHLPLATLLAAERQERLEWIQQRLEDLRPLLRLQDPEHDLESDDSWVRALDLLSLVVCHGWPEAQALTIKMSLPEGSTQEFRFNAVFESNRLILDPNPLRGTIRIPLRCREVQKRSFASDSEWALSLARAPWSSVDMIVGARPAA